MILQRDYSAQNLHTHIHTYPHIKPTKNSRHPSIHKYSEIFKYGNKALNAIS